MLVFDGAFGLILLAVWLFCIIDVITTDESQIRNLPKVGWLIIVLLFFDIGSLAWLIAGRPWSARTPPPTRAQRNFPEYDRPGRFAATNPDDDEAFLRQLRARAEEQRQRAAEQRRIEAERDNREDRGQR
jgi:hypothetical protein